MSARNRPPISTRGLFCALAVLGAALVLPTSAGAAPTCPNVEVSVHHDTSLPFNQNPCTGGTGAVTLNPRDAPPQHGTLSKPEQRTQPATPAPGFVGTDELRLTRGPT